MSGIEVLKALKEQNNKTPVVMLTTSTDESDLRDCLKYGAQGYLLKDNCCVSFISSLVMLLGVGWDSSTKWAIGWSISTGRKS
jgi:DNA-binding NarL/FixJ family response regulator